MQFINNVDIISVLSTSTTEVIEELVADTSYGVHTAVRIPRAPIHSIPVLGLIEVSPKSQSQSGMLDFSISRIDYVSSSFVGINIDHHFLDPHLQVESASSIPKYDTPAGSMVSAHSWKGLLDLAVRYNVCFDAGIT